jgi:hypothetical protein
VGGLVLTVLQFFRGWLDGIVPAAFRAAVQSQPWWLQAIEVILLSDLFIYWGHRLQHRVGFSGAFIRFITAPNTSTGWRRIASIQSIRFTRWD